MPMLMHWATLQNPCIFNSTRRCNRVRISFQRNARRHSTNRIFYRQRSPDCQQPAMTA
jgi:hypothetical protein